MAKSGIVANAAGVMSSFWIDLGKAIEQEGESQEDIMFLGDPENPIRAHLVRYLGLTLSQMGRAERNWAKNLLLHQGKFSPNHRRQRYEFRGNRLWSPDPLAQTSGTELQICAMGPEFRRVIGDLDFQNERLPTSMMNSYILQDEALVGEILNMLVYKESKKLGTLADNVNLCPADFLDILFCYVPGMPTNIIPDDGRTVIGFTAWGTMAIRYDKGGDREGWTFNLYPEDSYTDHVPWPKGTSVLCPVYPVQKA